MRSLQAHHRDWTEVFLRCLPSYKESPHAPRTPRLSVFKRYILRTFTWKNGNRDSLQLWLFGAMWVRIKKTSNDYYLGHTLDKVWVQREFSSPFPKETFLGISWSSGQAGGAAHLQGTSLILELLLSIPYVEGTLLTCTYSDREHRSVYAVQSMTAWGTPGSLRGREGLSEECFWNCVTQSFVNGDTE